MAVPVVVRGPSFGVRRSGSVVRGPSFGVRRQGSVVRGQTDFQFKLEIGLTPSGRNRSDPEWHTRRRNYCTTCQAE